MTLCLIRKLALTIGVHPAFRRIPSRSQIDSTERASLCPFAISATVRKGRELSSEISGPVLRPFALLAMNEDAASLAGTR